MRVLLCVTGSIAAYKAAPLCRLFKVAGCEVRVIMTTLAKEFITPLTMATLSKNPILVEFFNPENGEWNSHVSLGEWADVMLIAPATANTMAKMATGVADNLLLTTYLSARAPVVIAPAMDLDMYSHATTQHNMQLLRERGVHIVEPESGELASGLVGKGRMAEPQEIFDSVMELMQRNESLKGRHILVTAGATQEAIDPVRYISNHSTGKMGYAIAEALAKRGAEVTLISGVTTLATPQGCRRVDVVSAEQMYQASLEHFATADGAIMCAAVADYTPVEVAPEKIKKGGEGMTLTLKKSADIAATLGAERGKRVVIGFALESENEMENAKSKLERKGLSMIVLNSIREAGAGFGGDTNRVTFIDHEGCEQLPLMSKREVAEQIIDRLERLLC